MTVAKIFTSSRGQAVRLPKEFELSSDRVTVSRVSRSLVLTPVAPQWSDFFHILAEFDVDAPVERAQPASDNVREFPSIPGLQHED